MDTAFRKHVGNELIRLCDNNEKLVDDWKKAWSDLGGEKSNHTLLIGQETDIHCMTNGCVLMQLRLLESSTISQDETFTTIVSYCHKDDSLAEGYYLEEIPAVYRGRDKDTGYAVFTVTIPAPRVQGFLESVRPDSVLREYHYYLSPLDKEGAQTEILKLALINTEVNKWKEEKKLTFNSFHFYLKCLTTFKKE